jgi:hypothetical protein
VTLHAGAGKDTTVLTSALKPVRGAIVLVVQPRVHGPILPTDRGKVEETTTNGKVLLVASGDLRPSANAMCWPAQAAMEQQLCDAVRACGGEIERAHPYDPAQQHGFIASQKQGMAIFAGLDADAPIIVAEAVWQYSHHVFAGLTSHRGPILTVANWSGQWPELVGMLNLNGSLTKARARGRDRVPHRAAVGGGGRGVGRRDAGSRRRQRPRRHPGGDGGHEPKRAHHHAGWGRSSRLSRR